MRGFLCLFVMGVSSSVLGTRLECAQMG